MQIISTTQLRTQTSKLVKSLDEGNDLTLIHRSRIIGAIKPNKFEKSKPIDSKLFADTLKKLEPSKKMSYKEVMKMYDHYMMYRHGPRIS